MAAAGSPKAEPQREPAPVDAGAEHPDRASHAAAVAAPPQTGELLTRVAAQINEAFQSSLVQVVSDIGLEYGVDPSSNLAWMEKGGDVQLQVPKDVDEQRGELSDSVRRILRELQASRLQVHELQRIVEELREEQRLSKQRIALFSTLSSKLKRELVSERLALIDAKNEVKELRRSVRRSGDDSGSGGRSPQSPSLQEKPDNPWSSPDKPLAGSGGTSAAGVTGRGSGGSNLMAFNFYQPGRSEGDQAGDDDEPPSPSSSSHTLRSTLMGQFLPSSLLDSPQVTPKHARPFADDNLGEDKIPPIPATEMKSLSLSAPAPEIELSTSPTVEQTQGKSDVSELGDGHDELKETSQDDSGRLVSTVGLETTSVSPLKLSMLSELFDTVSVEELEAILQQFEGQESAAIEYILNSHPSFNPSASSGRAEGTSGNLTGMASPSPTRSTSLGHGKTGLHRSSSQGGASGPPPGSSSNWKTEICMYYMQGKCNKTRRTCSFAHGESDLVRPSGSASGGSSGKHGPNYKTRLCQAYENGTCPKSRRDCPMAHGVSDLRDGSSSGSGGNQPIIPAATPRLQSYKTELCYYFLKGNCNYTKEECRFAHGQSDLRTVESNTAQIAAAAAAAGASGYGGDFGASSPVPQPPLSMEKQLQIQHQYQQQYQHHQAPQQHHPFQPQPPPAQQQPTFVPQHQMQLQRGAGGQFAFQHQGSGGSAHPLQYEMHQQQQNPYMQPPGQFRYLKSMEDKRSSTPGSRPPRRDSGSSWSSFDASGLPPPEY